MCLHRLYLGLEGVPIYLLQGLHILYQLYRCMEPQGFLAASAFVSNLVFRTVAHVEKGIPKYKVGNGITAGKQGLRRQGCSPQKGKAQAQVEGK